MVEEKFEFTSKTKKNLVIFIVVGLVLSALGILLMNMGGGHGEEHAAEAAGGHHGFHWTQRLYANLWINNVFFIGLALVGVLFFAIQYAAQAGWSVGIKRIPLSFGAWIPVGALLMIAVYFVASHDLFHWTHSSLYDPSSPDYDSIIDGKKSYFFGTVFFPSFIMIMLLGNR